MQWIDSASEPEDQRGVMLLIKTYQLSYSKSREHPEQKGLFLQTKTVVSLNCFGAWGPLLGAPSRREGLKGRQVSSLLWSRPAAEQWMMFSLRGRTRRSSCETWRLAARSKWQRLCNDGQRGLGMAAPVRYPRNSRNCRRGGNLKKRRSVWKRGKGMTMLSFADRTY